MGLGILELDFKYTWSILQMYPGSILQYIWSIFKYAPLY